MSGIDAFFTRLAERMRKENQLSDVAWAFIRSVDGGLHWFLADFLGVEIPAAAKFTVSRECTLDTDSRADLVFEQVEAIDGQRHVVVVENKLWDRNYHFSQYEKASGILHSKCEGNVEVRVHFAQVAAHPVPVVLRQGEARGWKLKTWHEFITALAGARGRWPGQEVLVDGICSYVEAIVRGFKMEEIRFDRKTLNSLFFFDRLVREVVDEAAPSALEDRAECNVYGKASARCRGENWTGTYYRLWRRRNSNSFFPFFGLYFEHEPYICVVVEEDFNDAGPFSKLKELCGEKREWFVVEYEDYWTEVDIRLPAAKYKEFLRGDKEQQRALLVRFLSEVNSFLLGIPLGKR